MIDFKTTKLSYKDVRDDAYLALKALLDLPLKPDAMTEPVAFVNVKVARQRLRNHLDDMLIERNMPEIFSDYDGSCGGCDQCSLIAVQCGETECTVEGCTDPVCSNE